MKLYDYFRSTAAYRVRIVLNYKNLSYDLEEVHLVKDGGQQHQARVSGQSTRRNQCRNQPCSW